MKEVLYRKAKRDELNKEFLEDKEKRETEAKEKEKERLYNDVVDQLTNCINTINGKGLWADVYQGNVILTNQEVLGIMFKVYDYFAQYGYSVKFFCYDCKYQQDVKRYGYLCEEVEYENEED